MDIINLGKIGIKLDDVNPLKIEGIWSKNIPSAKKISKFLGTMEKKGFVTLNIDSVVAVSSGNTHSMPISEDWGGGYITVIKPTFGFGPVNLEGIEIQELCTLRVPIKTLEDYFVNNVEFPDLSSEERILDKVKTNCEKCHKEITMLDSQKNDKKCISCYNKKPGSATFYWSVS